MNEKEIRVYVTPRADANGVPNLQIPVVLKDPYLERTVELFPDGVISERFFNELKGDNGWIERIDDDFIVDRYAYIIRPDYKVVEFQKYFTALTVPQRIVAVKLMQLMQLPAKKEDWDRACKEALSCMAQPTQENIPVNITIGKKPKVKLKDAPDNNSEEN